MKECETQRQDLWRIPANGKNQNLNLCLLRQFTGPKEALNREVGAKDQSFQEAACLFPGPQQLRPKVIT